RTDQDRFARAGFSGDDVEARLQFQGQVGHKGEILDAQRRQHAVFIGGESGLYVTVEQKKKITALVRSAAVLSRSASVEDLPARSVTRDCCGWGQPRSILSS